VKRNISSSKSASSPLTDITNVNNVKPDISSEKRRKHMPPSDSGSIGLHECSTIVKQQKLPSKQIENTPERNQLSSGDSVNCNDSLVEPGVLTPKLKRTSTSSLESAVKCTIPTDQYFKRSRTNPKDTCDSKVLMIKRSILFHTCMFNFVNDMMKQITWKKIQRMSVSSLFLSIVLRVFILSLLVTAYICDELSYWHIIITLELGITQHLQNRFVR
jgi:hypothetical protein